MARSTDELSLPALPKAPTGIQGLDEITNGGLPRGRPTLVCGAAGCGKTLLGIEFLVRGAIQYNEPGVLMSFEETAEELTANVASLGFDLPGLVAANKLLIDYVHIERSEIEETGEYDLEGLFIRLDQAISQIGAQRVVLDTVESLFAGLPNALILRSELRRLFHWLKNRGVTVIITGESGEKTLTRHGLEEYVSDCVIVLDNRVHEQLCTRRLRVAKYRGSLHGTNEYPFLIDAQGISVLPVTSLGLSYASLAERISSGIPGLDEMLGGKGFFRASSILVSGTAGTGKTSIAAHFVEAACRRGEKALYFAFEESANQIMRNMHSIGIDLEQWNQVGLLKFHTTRPSLHGLEMHLATIFHTINDFNPGVVIVDPLSSFVAVGSLLEAKSMLMRLIDSLKMKRITSLLTNLSSDNDEPEQTDVGISSLMDTWVMLRNIESAGERNRGLYILKSRGMAHSNQVREFLLTDTGAQLRDVTVGPEGVLIGSARLAQQAQEETTQLARVAEAQHLRVNLEHKRQALEAQIAVMRAEFATEEAEVAAVTSQAQQADVRLAEVRARMARDRQAES
ncbi:MAG: circadian clock protein KaiC [Anaerolineae bacterium]